MNSSKKNNAPSQDSKQDIASLCERPTTRYADLGGVESILQTVRELIEYPLAHPEIYAHIGVEPPRGILLHGPPGCGKTLLANAMAGQLGVAFLKISAPEIVSGMSGESEQKVREIFNAAIENAPAILFIDEVDAIMSKRDNNARGMEKRIVAQLLTCMDSLSMENTNNKPVMVIGATNRPDSLDSALRRAGRFDREICMGVPDEKARCRILKVMTAKMRLEGDFDFDAIAKKTPGYVGADIRSLTKEAAVIAINRIFKDMLNMGNLNMLDSSGSLMNNSDSSTPFQAIPLSPSQLDPLSVTMDDFLQAVKTVQPSSKREGFATVPDVSWSQIGALADIREELELSILEPIANPERFEMLGLSMPAGVMLYGPPGCGKTLLAKAIAGESGANFISVKGPELLDKFVGESERAVRQVFERARASSPCVVFFDELDSLCPRRGSDGGGGGGVSERVVNQLLTELDGLDSRKSVFVVAATNRPELIDPAMLRPGRLDKLLYVPLPGSEDRASIMKALCKSANIEEGVDVQELAKGSRANGYSGADLSALLREAGLACLKENTADKLLASYDKDKKIQIEKRHFEQAFHSVMPSVSKEDQLEYDRIRDRISRARSRQGGGGGGGSGGGGGGGGSEKKGVSNNDNDMDVA
jgi:ribosome biogenesis ATPase